MAFQRMLTVSIGHADVQKPNEMMKEGFSMKEESSDSLSETISDLHDHDVLPTRKRRVGALGVGRISYQKEGATGKLINCHYPTLAVYASYPFARPAIGMHFPTHLAPIPDMPTVLCSLCTWHARWFPTACLSHCVHGHAACSHGLIGSMWQQSMRFMGWPKMTCRFLRHRIRITYSCKLRPNSQSLSS